MMVTKYTKSCWTGVILVILGVVCYVLEMTFYGGIDENNVLQESLFLPLAFILGFLGILVVIISLIMAAMKGRASK